MGNFIKKDKIILLIIWIVFIEFASPQHNYFLLTFIQFIPFFYCIYKDKKNWLKMAIIFGLSYYIIYYRWLIYPIKYTNFSPYILGPINVFLMAIYQTLYFVIFTYFFVKLKNFIILSVIWGILEYIKAHILTGFPWGELSYNLYKAPILINIAEIIKSEGISAFIMLTNLLIFYAIIEKNKRKKLIIGTLLLFGIYITINLWILKNTKIRNFNLKIALIQGNIPEKIKLDEKNNPFVVREYIRLTKEILPKKPDLIIWPEAIYLTPFETDNSSIKKIFLNFIKKNKLSIIFGSIYTNVNVETMNIKVFNSMYFIKNGDVKNFKRYDKIHLVPFGEYTPLKKVLFFINKIVPGIDYSSGKKTVIFKIKKAKIIPLICYEGIFSDLIKKGIKKGGNLIVNISNEAWFGNSSALYQHIAIDVLKAVEFKKYFIKCANSGISAIILPTGKILKIIPPEKRGIIFMKI